MLNSPHSRSLTFVILSEPLSVSAQKKTMGRAKDPETGLNAAAERGALRMTNAISSRTRRRLSSPNLSLYTNLLPLRGSRNPRVNQGKPHDQPMVFGPEYLWIPAFSGMTILDRGYK